MIFSLVCFGGGVVLGAYFPEKILPRSQFESEKVFLQSWRKCLFGLWCEGLSTRRRCQKAMRQVPNRSETFPLDKTTCFYVRQVWYGSVLKKEPATSTMSNAMAKSLDSTRVTSMRALFACFACLSVKAS